MLKKTITYTDFNGEEVTEDHFFHLSKAELVELELSHQGGLSAALERIVAAEDGKQIIAEFKNIILGSYGKKSLDGRRFIKNQEIREEFESSEAYSTMFMELVTETDKAVEFINGVMPADLVQEAAQTAANAEKPALEAVPAEETESEPKSWPEGLLKKIAHGEITRAEFNELDQYQVSEIQSLIDEGDLRIVE